MGRDGSGTYSLPEAAFVFDTVISETAVNSNFSDIAAALTASLAKDGQTTPTANLPLGGFKLTGMGVGSTQDDSITLRQVQANAYGHVTSDTGAADAYAIAPSPAIAAYAAGQRFAFIAANASTGASTIDVSGLGAKALQYQAAALTGAEIKAGALVVVEYDGTQFQIISPSDLLTANSGDMLGANNLSDVGSAATSFGNIKQAATEAATGVVEIATAAEVRTQADALRAVTPSTVRDMGGAPATDHTAVGPFTSAFSAGESVTLMDVVFFKSDGEWWKTDADAEATSKGMLAVSLETKADGEAMSVALPGSFVRDDTFDWTVGAVLYLDTATAGGLTETAPSGSGDIVRVAGFAMTADVVFFDPSPDWAEVT